MVTSTKDWHFVIASMKHSLAASSVNIFSSISRQRRPVLPVIPAQIIFSSLSPIAHAFMDRVLRVLLHCKALDIHDQLSSDSVFWLRVISAKDVFDVRKSWMNCPPSSAILQRPISSDVSVVEFLRALRTDNIPSSPSGLPFNLEMMKKRWLY